MKERSIAHHHAEIIGNNGDTTAKLYSTDNLGNIWGEEFTPAARADSVLGRRRLGLSLLAASITTTAYCLPFVLELGVFKKHKKVKSLGSIVVLGLGKGLLDWRDGIDEMLLETQGRINALDQAKKRVNLT